MYLKDVKSAFLVLFFGELPPYFGLWAKSCEANHKNFHWFVYNDKIKIQYELNCAVTMVPYTFGEMITDFKNILNINIPDVNTKIVCDCRTVLFALRQEKDSLDKFDFIGYSDVDLIYGQLDKFLPEDMLQYSMISADDNRPCGPFTLINRKYIKNICEDDRIKKRLELSLDIFYNNHNKLSATSKNENSSKTTSYEKLHVNTSPNSINKNDEVSKFAPVSNKTCNPEDVKHSNFGHLDESIELLDIAKEYAPVFCKATPLQPTMTPEINHRRAFAIWENGAVTVWDNRGRSKEGGFFHFSRFKNKKRFKVKDDVSNAKKWGIYKYGSIEIYSKWTFAKMMLTLYY